jgi:hypothetical protein
MRKAFGSHGIEARLSFPGRVNRIYLGSTSNEVGVLEVSIFRDMLTASTNTPIDPPAERKFRKIVRVGNVIVFIRTPISPRSRQQVGASLVALRQLQ